MNQGQPQNSKTIAKEALESLRELLAASAEGLLMLAIMNLAEKLDGLERQTRSVSGLKFYLELVLTGQTKVDIQVATQSIISQLEEIAVEDEDIITPDFTAAFSELKAA